MTVDVQEHARMATRETGTSRRPRVGIGLPVFNGERYLAAAVDSLLNQTFSDFVLLISDNASTDGTSAICERYARLDPRVRYVREPVNTGAVRNHNKTIELLDCEFFKWAAHDDIYAPTFLERCVDAMDAYPDAVVAYTRARFIDAAGNPLRDYKPDLDLGNACRRTRFLQYVCANHVMIEDYGLIRTPVLKSTKLLGNYVWSDMVLFGELALHGPFIEIPEMLFLRRDHPRRAMNVNRDARSLSVWNDPRGAGGSRMPTWRTLGGYWASIWRSPMGLDDKLVLGLESARRAYWTRQLGSELWRAMARSD